MDTKNIRGINLKKLSTILIAIEAILFVLAILFSVEVYINHTRVDKITDDYIKIQSDIYNLQTASDFLSAKSRQFVMTGEAIFAREYFEEVNETKRRDNAVDNIKDMVSDVGYGATGHIEKALEKSNNLMVREIHAMALVASLDEGDAAAALPQEIKSYSLSEKELNLPPQERREKAYSLVFGDGYSEEKLSIRQSVDNATDNLLGELGNYKASCSIRYQISFVILMVLLASSVTTFAAIAICLFRLVLHPLTVSISSIQEENLIPFCNSFELNYLAATYNNAFEANAKTRLHLKSKAERDELTGLLNRSAFNDLATFYKDASEGLAFLIIDVDNFKTINDTYGHAIGDEALKRVASLLEECFRSNDFPIRYGGDEFVVIMTELSPGQSGVIKRKIDYINSTLQNPIDDIPKLSVSVGIAFSNQGFTSDLFEKADEALYQTKENGRCGYTFA